MYRVGQSWKPSENSGSHHETRSLPCRARWQSWHLADLPTATTGASNETWTLPGQMAELALGRPTPGYHGRIVFVRHTIPRMASGQTGRVSMRDSLERQPVTPGNNCNDVSLERRPPCNNVSQRRPLATTTFPLLKFLESSMMRISPSHKKLISKQSLVYKGHRSR
jgi:hypothetical protein